MFWKWIEAVVLLPFNVLVIIPAVTLYFTDYIWELNSTYLLIVGTILLVSGLFLAGRTMRLFSKKGKGTAAPFRCSKKKIWRKDSAKIMRFTNETFLAGFQG